MSSTIFYRFQSSNLTNRIPFDGTGLTIFDLKREIILSNKLGDGTDYQLKLYNMDTEEEYDDDTMVIPRSSSVLVKRLPAIRGNKFGNSNINSLNASNLGNAVRYVTGKPRVNVTKKPVRSSMENTTNSTTTNMNTNINTNISSNGTEDEKIANMFANQENQWEQTQQEMSIATPVFTKPSNVSNNIGDEGPPPPGYMCYRCGGRNHWIKNCPTNNDPNFEGKRIKRTTGIPKKFLKSIEIDPTTLTNEEIVQRKIMITDEGKFVVQIADQESWNDYQRKQQKRLINSKDAVWKENYFKDLPEELKCPITKGILKDPVKTTKCCNKFFSKMALEDSLLESDFVCPSCGATDILLDSLVDDKEMAAKVDKFIKEQAQTDTNAQPAASQNDSAVHPAGLDGHPPAKKAHVEGNTATSGAGASNVTSSSSAIPMLPLPMFPMFPMPFVPNLNNPNANSKK